MFLFLRKRTKIADLACGDTVVIEGEVKVRYELRIPKSGTLCVYYDILLESYRMGARGRGRPLWFPDRVDRYCSGFFVVDHTGLVWIKGDVECMLVKGGYKENGMLDKKGQKRYSAKMIRKRDRVRVRGVVTEPDTDTPAGVAVIIPDHKGILEIYAHPNIRRRQKLFDESIAIGDAITQY